MRRDSFRDLHVLSGVAAGLAAIAACGGASAGLRPAQSTSVTARAAVAPVALPSGKLLPSVLDLPSFTAPPAQLRAIASGLLDDDGPVAILRDDYDAAYDADGRVRDRWRYVFVVRSADTEVIDSWSHRSNSYSPSSQSRPNVRARVIAPDGKVATLDPASVTYAPAGAGTDRVRYRYDLPGLTTGSIVEEEVTSPPMVAPIRTATQARFYLGASVPTFATHVTLSAPVALHLQPYAFALPAGAFTAHAISGGVDHWTYQVTLLGPNAKEEDDLAADARALPFIALSLADSWGAVARQYHDVIERVLVDDPAPWPASVPRAPTRATVAQLLAWTQDTIADANITLDDGSLAPVSPAATVAARTGSRLDRAVVLLSLLRQAGVDAELAGLRIGPGVDTAPEVPGLATFNEVLIRTRLDGQTVWLSPATAFAVPGQLDPSEQGRHVLVFAAATTALVQTPDAVAGDNVVSELRRYALAEMGSATSVDETTREGGIYESQFREWLRTEPRAATEKQFADYLTSEYGATFGSLAYTAPADRTRPFDMVLRGTLASKLYTHRDRIDLEIRYRDVLDKVPSLFTARPEASADDDGGDDAASAPAPRTRAFEWPTPHEYVIVHHFVIPDGFAASAPLPTDEERTLGTTTYLRKLELKGNVLEITQHFKSGKRRLTAAEYEATRAAIQAALDGGLDLHITLDHTAWHLAAEGQFKPALAELARLIAAHPRSAVVHGRRAYVLVQTGVGAAAVAAAVRATQVDPRDADAFTVLAWARRFDPFGREVTGPWDRAGAIAAAMQARRIDPTHSGAPIEAARLLECDARGYRYEPGAQLAEAIRQWRAAYQLDAVAEPGLALARALLQSGARGFAEAEHVLRELDVGTEQQQLLVAAVALLEGPEAALAEAAKHVDGGTTRDELVLHAIQQLDSLRQYDVGTELGRLGGTPRATAARRQAISTGVTTQPDQAVLGVLAWLATGADTRDRISSERIADAQTARELETAHVDSAARAALADLGPTRARDVALSFAAPTVTGERGGPWRVAVQQGGHPLVVYVVLQRGHAVVIGSAQASAGVGRAVLRLASTDLGAATTLVGWLARDRDDATPGLAEPSMARDAVLIAGARLAGLTGGALAVATLARCSDPRADVRSECALTLAALYRDAHRWRELLALGDSHIDHDVMDFAAHARIHALIGLGRFPEARVQLDALAATDHTGIVPFEIELAIAQHDDEGLAAATDSLASSTSRGRVETAVLVEAVWARLPTTADLARTKDIAVRSVGDTSAVADPEALSALAVVEVEGGEVVAARDHARQAMATREATRPVDWYVFGRIAETLGLRADAAAYYRKVLREPALEPRPTAYSLAQHRLAALRKP